MLNFAIALFIFSVTLLAIVLIHRGSLPESLKHHARQIQIVGETKALELTGHWKVTFEDGRVVRVDGDKNMVLIPPGQKFNVEEGD